MSIPLSPAALWRLKANRAEFQLDSWSGSIDLAHPSRGVEVHQNSTILPSGARVLGIEVGKHAAELGAPVDAYVREADLVALYAESAEFPFGIQIYWSLAPRQVAGKSALQIDLMISIQTQQLGVRAQIATNSQIATSAAWQSTPVGALMKSGEAVSIAAGKSQFHGDRESPWILAELTRPTKLVGCGVYIETTLPSDFLRAEIELDEKALSVHRDLLDETMEKGVIRRLRCRGIFVSEPVGPEVADLLYQELCSEKPRLTT